MRSLIAGILLLIGTVSVSAQEIVLSERFVGVGGTICNTADEVREALRGGLPQGCGVLTRPMVMRITALEKFKGKYIVRYDFLNAPKLPAQFGMAPIPRASAEPI